jgi:hypothetical protein
MRFPSTDAMGRSSKRRQTFRMSRGPRPGDFQTAVAYFSEIRRVGLESFAGEERETFELQMR